MACLTTAHRHSDIASAASSSSASTSYPAYDVFINHRGPDVKNTFASHLYMRLHNLGVLVFLDKPELEAGHNILSQIKAAIQMASVHIVIFSPTYAESKWCLDELVLMVKSRGTILPIFYNVKPSDLRWTIENGTYAEALRKQQQKTTRDPETSEEKPRHDCNTIKDWRDALSYVADISGLELEAFNWNEQDLLANVVQTVLKIFPKAPLFVATHPTGLDDKLQDFERSVLLQQKQEESVKTTVLGIVGAGGIGKTTLAKEFFNRRRSCYNRSSFLFDVRENAVGKSLNNLQMKLIKDLTQKEDIQIDSPDEGIAILKQRLSYCHALVILDDVDKADQLEVLLPIKDVLSSHSLILVISRDKHVLIRSGILDSSIYRLSGMTKRHSQELFCSNAFYQPYPLPGFTDLVERFVTACDGLPLSLKVIGGLLCGRNDTSYWEDQLNELNKILPDDIQKRLEISYQSLNQVEQKIFLDIACFFKEKTMDTAIRIWGSVGLLSIESKCLLEVDSNNLIKMHDHIRDMGRKIAEERSMPRRLWRYTAINSIDTLFEQSMSAETEVRGIWTVRRCKHRSSVTPSKMSWFKRWSHEVLGNCNWTGLFNNDGYYGTDLQILASEDVYLKGILRRVRSPHLIWIRWFKCPCSSLPSWVPLENVRVLELIGSRLKMLWQHEYQAPLQLRELNIYAPISHFPKSIGQLEHLEKIVLENGQLKSVPLQTLPEEFCRLRSLKYLVLKRCSRLRSLPDSFGNLTNLRLINLSYATSLEMLPDSFGKLTNLRHMDLSYAGLLRMLPNSFGDLTRLKHLSLKSCSSVTISNETLGNITTLEYLNLSGCKNVKELPPQVPHQWSLEKLYLRLTGFENLPSRIGELCNLEVLELGEQLLEVLPASLPHLRSLKDLLVVDMPELICLPDTFGLLTQLTKLRLHLCGIQYLPQDLLEMNNLEILEVKDCPLGELPFKNTEGERETLVALNPLDSSNDKCMLGLKSLELSGVEINEVTFPEGVCPSLQRLFLCDCEELWRIGRLCGLEKLQHLEIRSCANIKKLPSLETLTSLEEMDVRKCGKLKSIQGLGQLTKLRKLAVSDCHEIKELPGLEHLILLEVLQASGCHNLRGIQGLAQLTKLRRLYVNGCHKIQELPGVENIMSLIEFDARDCPKLHWGRGAQEQLRQRLKKRFRYGKQRKRRCCLPQEDSDESYTLVSSSGTSTSTWV